MEKFDLELKFQAACSMKLTLLKVDGILAKIVQGKEIPSEEACALMKETWMLHEHLTELIGKTSDELGDIEDFVPPDEEL